MIAILATVTCHAVLVSRRFAYDTGSWRFSRYWVNMRPSNKSAVKPVANAPSIAIPNMYAPCALAHTSMIGTTSQSRRRSPSLAPLWRHTFVVQRQTRATSANESICGRRPHVVSEAVAATITSRLAIIVEPPIVVIVRCVKRSALMMIAVVRIAKPVHPAN